jgi:spermidine/putrescine-binding protein
MVKLREMVLILLGLALISTLLVGRLSKTLYIFNWTYYTPVSVIQKFEQE